MLLYVYRSMKKCGNNLIHAAGTVSAQFNTILSNNEQNICSMPGYLGHLVFLATPLIINYSMS